MKEPIKILATNFPINNGKCTGPRSCNVSLIDREVNAYNEVLVSKVTIQGPDGNVTLTNARDVTLWTLAAGFGCKFCSCMENHGDAITGAFE